jgi:hypothetical protein
MGKILTQARMRPIHGFSPTVTSTKWLIGNGNISFQAVDWRCFVTAQKNTVRRDFTGLIPAFAGSLPKS